MLQVLFYVFLSTTGILCLYYLLVFLRFVFHKKQASADTVLPEVSILICAKNEAENLKNNLPSIINQNYSKDFEIVLINDASIDETLEVMEHFQQKNTNITLVNVENNEAFWGSKKYALTLGIKTAKYEHLIFTDADCQAASQHWLNTLAQNFSTKTSIALGYGAYQKKKNSLLNQLIRFETLHTAIQYFSYALAGNPYMGVGRNLAYTKTNFFSVNGFINHMKIRSGDDDLFINEVATKKNTTICYDQEAHTISTTPNTFLAWFQQKRRHVSTANHYKKTDQFLLGTYYSSLLLFLISSTVLLSTTYLWKIVLIVFGVKLMLQYLVFGFSAKKLKESSLIFAIPFYELILVLFHFIIFITNLIQKPNHWK